MWASSLPFYDNVYITHSLLPRANFPSELMIIYPSFSSGNLFITFLSYIFNCFNSIGFLPFVDINSHAQAFIFLKKQMKKERKQKDACHSQFYYKKVTILKVYYVSSKYRRWKRDVSGTWKVFRAPVKSIWNNGRGWGVLADVNENIKRKWKNAQYRNNRVVEQECGEGLDFMLCGAKLWRERKEKRLWKKVYYYFCEIISF